MFITLEGPEGSGKTSHIPHLVEFLREKGHIVFPTREPGGTSISEQIRDVLHDMKRYNFLKDLTDCEKLCQEDSLFLKGLIQKP
jgi:thymidylate kinase